ncbi:DDT domain protein [Aspergillus luchuensis]|uniref:DDT domain protein n=1 Tax=Aspergillus kawachii TaxID=1069201 RepID=A0A146F7F5_ASPKA|nr:DDT domain protein [Aspergillus luchuensis]
MSSPSSISLASIPEDRPLPLHIISWGHGSLSHWAIFLPYQMGGTKGILYHIGYEERRSFIACTTSSRLSKEPFRAPQSRPTRSSTIPGAFATFAQVEDAVNKVYEDYKIYNIFTRNCQLFVLDVFLRLHQLYPTSVPASAIRDIRRRGTISTLLALSIRGTPVAYPVSEDRLGNPNRYEID